MIFYRFKISEKKNALFLVKEYLNTKCPKLGKISLAEILSNVTNSSILENPQFGGVSVVVAMVIVITSVIVGGIWLL